MTSGVDAVVFGPEADEPRAFFRDTLGLPSVAAGAGWLIFALPPAELAVHPADASRHALYLLCDDLDATVGALAAKGVRLAGLITEQAWGRVTALALPDGSEIGLYQPPIHAPAQDSDGVRRPRPGRRPGSPGAPPPPWRTRRSGRGSRGDDGARLRPVDAEEPATVIVVHHPDRGHALFAHQRLGAFDAVAADGGSRPRSSSRHPVTGSRRIHRGSPPSAGVAAIVQRQPFGRTNA